MVFPVFPPCLPVLYLLVRFIRTCLEVFPRSSYPLGALYRRVGAADSLHPSSSSNGFRGAWRGHGCCHLFRRIASLLRTSQRLGFSLHSCMSLCYADRCRKHNNGSWLAARADHPGGQLLSLLCQGWLSWLGQEHKTAAQRSIPCSATLAEAELCKLRLGRPASCTFFNEKLCRSNF